MKDPFIDLVTEWEAKLRKFFPGYTLRYTQIDDGKSVVGKWFIYDGDMCLGLSIVNLHRYMESLEQNAIREAIDGKVN